MEQLWDLIVYNFIGCLLVFARVAGIFTFNPIFGRQNVPMRVRVAMSLAFAVSLLAVTGGSTGFIPLSIPHFVFTLLAEAFFGLVFGFLTNMFLTALILAGESTDRQVGFMMAKVMDPGTGIQMPIFGTIYYYIFVLYFFLTNGHLEYIRLFALSYNIVPMGFEFTWNTFAVTHNLVMFFGTIFTLAMKLALPVISAGLIVEVCVGVIMKAVPTIQVFVVNIQLKIIFGLFVILSLARPISDFIDRLLEIMWENMDAVLHSFI
ncbi:MAG: flagellar biosynthetic protein FliR [Oscillospiraceae bacterium]|jgi:flagellar biosynthetic protein FliR|nr:flagellar biosynthetic protein FliR [Oscillospiraceae bacterium]